MFPPKPASLPCRPHTTTTNPLTQTRNVGVIFDYFLPGISNQSPSPSPEYVLDCPLPSILRLLYTILELWQWSPNYKDRVALMLLQSVLLYKMQNELSLYYSICKIKVQSPWYSLQGLS